MKFQSIIRAVTTASLAIVVAACGMRELPVAPKVAGAPEIDATNLIGWPDNSTTATLTWTVDSDLDWTHGFRIYRDGKVIGLTNQLTYTDHGLKPNTTYMYRVATIHADGSDVALSNHFQITTGSDQVLLVSVSPNNGNLVAGRTQQLVAVVRDSATNVVISGKTISWSSGNGAVATVSSSGMLTTFSPGSVDIAATVEGAVGYASFTVQTAPPATVASLTITPSTSTIEVAKTVQLSAIARDSAGNTLSGRTVTWSSSSASTASINTTGVVTAVAQGTVVIQASIDGAQATAVVNVVPPTSSDPDVVSITVTPSPVSLLIGGAVQLTATPRDVHGNAITGRTITWSSANGSVASVTAAGVVSAAAVGSTVIVARADGAAGSAVVNVSPVPQAPPAAVSTISLSPATVSTWIGALTQLVATVRDAEGNVLTGRTISWSASGGSIVSISGDGLVTGLAIGASTVTAVSEGKSATAQFTVFPLVTPPASVISVTVTPSTNTAVAGSHVQLTATPRDANNNALTGRFITWVSSNPLVAIVSPTGSVTAVTAGTATITATCEGISGTASFTVTALPGPIAVNTVTVSPSTLSVPIGGTEQLTAVTKDVNGVVLTGRAILWTSTNPLVATVSQSGLVTGISSGSATITATSEGKTGSAAATITQLPVASLNVVPSTMTLIAGLSGQMIAVTKDAHGVILFGRVVTWTSSNAAVATVSSNGTVTAVSAGSATITATSEGVIGTGSITVLPKPVVTVSLNPPSPNLCVGASLQLSVVAKDADGNVLTGRAVVWTTNTGLVGSVSNNGLVLGLSLGTVTITATVEGVSASVTLSLCPAIVATVNVTAPSGLLSILGLPMQLLATPRDGLGNIITGRTVSWSISPPLKALLSLNGLVTPLLTGGITVTATVDGVQGSINLSIGN